MMGPVGRRGVICSWKDFNYSYNLSSTNLLQNKQRNPEGYTPAQKQPICLTARAASGPQPYTAALGAPWNRSTDAAH